jgi:hypothetical protein
MVQQHMITSGRSAHHLPLFMKWLLGVVVFAGCGQEACPNVDDQKVTTDSPIIDNLWLIDHAMPDDPWALVLALTFQDKNGDLSSGSAAIYINNRHEKPTTVDLFPSFRDSALLPGSTTGTLTLPTIRITNVSDGQTIRLGVRLTDGSKHSSNCYDLDLNFRVKTAASQLTLQLQRIAALIE